MKTKKILSFIAAIMLGLSSYTTVFAAEDQTFALSDSPEQSDTTFADNKTEDIINTELDNNNTIPQDNNSGLEGMGNDYLSQQNEESQNEDHSLNYNDFSAKMNDFLNSAGFNYDDFNDQKFDLPDISSMGSAADLKEEYASVISSLSDFQFGERMTLPDNSGYSLNVIGSFKDSFGNGLKSDFSQYSISMDPSEIFNKAASTRNALFSNVYNSDIYQSVNGNLNISNTLSKIQAYSIDPSSVSTSMSSLDSLKNRVNGYYTNDANAAKGNFNYKKGTSQSTFLSDQFSVLGDNGVKSQLDNRADNWFIDRKAGPISKKDGTRLDIDYRDLTLEERMQWQDNNKDNANDSIQDTLDSIKENKSNVDDSSDTNFFESIFKQAMPKPDYMSEEEYQAMIDNMKNLPMMKTPDIKPDEKYVFFY